MRHVAARRYLSTVLVAIGVLLFAAGVAHAAGTPSAAVMSDGSEYVYFRGENGAIWQADSFGGVKELGGSAAGNPVVVALPDGERDVYYRGTNGAIWRWYFDPSTQAWSLSTVGGVTVGEPAVSPGYPYSVFFRQGEGCQRCIYQGYLSGGSWHTRALGGDDEGTPVAVTNSSGVEEVYWSHTSSGVIEEWYSAEPMSGSAEWHYTEAGGTATAERPAAVTYPSGKVAVYFQAKEGCIGCVDALFWNGSSWSTSWGGGSLAGGPVAEPESESSQHVYWRGSNEALWSDHGSAAEPWSFEQLGGKASGNPAETHDPGATVSTDLYYFDSTAGLSDLYEQSGEWHNRQLCAAPCSSKTPAAPAVGAVTPDAGLTTGEETVAITGSNFSEVTAVKFGGTNATSYTVESSGRITAVAPPGSSGTVDVKVTAAGGTSATMAADEYTYVSEGPGPAVTKVSPSSGPTAGGTSVTIKGTGYTGVTSVKFGATAASFTVDSSTEITATAPAEEAGVVDITVRTPNGTSPTSNRDHYKYTPTISGISPNAGPIAGGNTVTITGTGFIVGTEETAFRFDSTRSKHVECSTSTTCVAVVPAHAAGTVEVTAIVDKADSPSAAPYDEYTYE